MQQSLEQFLFSLISIVVGGGIAIATQWILAREKQKSENLDKLRTSKLEKYNVIWAWLCDYDKPCENLETIHNSWGHSRKKYSELRSLYLSALPFVSKEMSQALLVLLEFWNNDLMKWRGTNQLSTVQDRPCANVEEYNRLVEKVFTTSQADIKYVFNLEQ